MGAERFSGATFADLIQAGILEIGDGYRAKLSELGGSGSIFLRAGHVTDQEISFVGVDRFKDEHGPAVRSKLSRPGDVVVTTKGNSIGRTAYVTKEMPEFVYSPHLSYWRSLEPARLVSGFLRYWANGPEFIGQLHGMKASTDMAPYLSLSDQRRLRLTLPQEPTQTSIAKVLEALDHKIDLDRRVSRTLTAMTRAVFRSWFVEFDPVAAKAAGRQPAAMARETAILFSERFGDSPGGPLPFGWCFGRLTDLADINARQLSENGAPETIRYIDISSVSVGRIDAVEQYSWASAPSRARRLVRHGDTIWSCVRPNRRSYCLIRHPEPDLVVSTGFAVLSPREDAAAFVYLWTTTEDFVDYLTSHAEGSAYPAVRADSFARATVLIPPFPVLKAFELLVDPLLELVWRIEEEARTLAGLRDTLLPKLLSGEIRVREAEKLAGEAGA
jgi:type I restriction enzyme S subunit